MTPAAQLAVSPHLQTVFFAFLSLVVRIIADDARTRSRVVRLRQCFGCSDRWKTQTWCSTIAFTFSCSIFFSLFFASELHRHNTARFSLLVSIQCWVSLDWVEKSVRSAVNCLRCVFGQSYVVPWKIRLEISHQVRSTNSRSIKNSENPEIMSS